MATHSRLAVLAGLLSLSALIAFAAGSDADKADRLIQWEQRGAASGQALIFLPGLGFPGASWAGVAAQFEKDHPIFLATYAGTGGVPPAPPPYLSRMVSEIRELIESRKLERPILVGHLMGTQLALHVAGRHPNLVAGVFGMPVPIDRAPPDQREQRGREVTESFLRQPLEMWKPNLGTWSANGCEDPAVGRTVYALVSECDRETYAHMLGEYMADPIEDLLPKVTVPVSLVVPASVPPNADITRIRPSEYAQQLTDQIRAMHAGLARCDVISMRRARFYAPIEFPERVAFSLRRYLEKLANKQATWSTTIGAQAPTSLPASSGDDEP